MYLRQASCREYQFSHMARSTIFQRNIRKHILVVKCAIVCMIGYTIIKSANKSYTALFIDK